MDRWRAAGALLALAACIASSAAAPTSSNQTALDVYDGAPEGCYYNFQHYGEGDRIMTNEPCLNCTCHNRMLMCYLRVCPFTKAIGQDCTVEKRADQCCPIVTCPDVPVDLLTSTSTTSPAEYGATGLGKLDKYGCSINGKYFPEGSKVPPTPNKPCEHCYCIRNMTTCVMQECTLHVDGCTPIYHKDVCCPVRYSCDHPEDEIPLLDDMTTTVRPTPGFLLTTTTVSPVTQMTQDCVHDDQIFPDGALIKTEKACEHCYCMKGDIVCVVQECGTPMENEGKNCTSLPPREGQCCPDTYICEGDGELSSETPFEITPTQDIGELTTIAPPRRVAEGSGYRNEPDDSPHVETTSPESDIEGSGEDQSLDDINEKEQEPEGHTESFATTEVESISTSTKTSFMEEVEEHTPAIDLSKVNDISTEDNISEDVTKAYSPSTTDIPRLEEVEKSTAEPMEIHGTISEKESSELDQLIPVATTATSLKEPEQDTTEAYDAQGITTNIVETEAEDINTKEQLSSTIAPATEFYEGQHIEPNDISVPEISKPEEYTPITTTKPLIDDIESTPTKQTEQDAVPDNDILKQDDTSTDIPILEDSDIYTTETTQDQDIITSFIPEKESIEPEQLIPFTTSVPNKEESSQSNIIPDRASDSDLDEFIPISTSVPGLEEISKLTSEPKKEIITSTTSNIIQLEETEETTLGSIEKQDSTPAIVTENISSETEVHVPRTTINPEIQESESVTSLPEEEQNVIPDIKTTSGSISEYESNTESQSIPASSITDSSTKITSVDETTPVVPKATESLSFPDEKEITKTEYPTAEYDLSTPTLPKEEQTIITTEATLRKEDSGEPSDVQKQPELDTETGTAATLQPEKQTKPTITMNEETESTSATLQDKEPTETLSSSTQSQNELDAAYTIPTTEKVGSIETTTINIGDNEIDEESAIPPGRIPGEGDCLIDGITYRNESVVPSTNKCHTSCKCISSIIKCDPIICSPPPEYMNNCQSIYDSPESCCPTYVCDHSKETVPPESQSQMSGTEKPVLSPSIECQGDQCEIVKGETMPTIGDQASAVRPCEGADCDTTTDKPMVSDIPEVPAKQCDGDTCDSTVGKEPISDRIPELPEESIIPCEGESCDTAKDKTPAPEIPQEHTEPCKGDTCDIISDKTSAPETQEKPVTPCEGINCDKMFDEAQKPQDTKKSEEPCEGEGCEETPEMAPITEIPEKSTLPCEGDNCNTVVDTTPVLEVPAKPLKPCEGDDCGSNLNKDQSPEVPKETVKPCEGIGCEITTDSTVIPEVSEPVGPCEGDSCISLTDHTHALQIPEEAIESCLGDGCKSTSEITPITETPDKSMEPCEGDSCTLDKAPIPEMSIEPVKPCEGDACDITTDKIDIPEVLIEPVKSCIGDSCDATSEQIPLPEMDEGSSKPCNGDICDSTSDKTPIHDIEEHSETVCEGDGCGVTSSSPTPDFTEEPLKECKGEGCVSSDKVLIPDVQEEPIKPCDGDGCEVSPDKVSIPDEPEKTVKPCEGDDCDTTTGKTPISDGTLGLVTPCEGDNCGTTQDQTHIPEDIQAPVQVCEGIDCVSTTDNAQIPELVAEPVKPCDGEGCEITSNQSTLPDISKEPVKPCEGDSCDATSDKTTPSNAEEPVKACEGDVCDASSDITPMPEVIQESGKPCGGEDCGAKLSTVPVPETLEESVKPCEGAGCEGILHETTEHEMPEKPIEPCEGEGCTTVDKLSDTPQIKDEGICTDENGCEKPEIYEPICVGISCRRQESPNVESQEPSKCAGIDCPPEAQTEQPQYTPDIGTSTSLIDGTVDKTQELPSSEKSTEEPTNDKDMTQTSTPSIIESSEMTTAPEVYLATSKDEFIGQPIDSAVTDSSAEIDTTLGPTQQDTVSFTEEEKQTTQTSQDVKPEETGATDLPDTDIIGTQAPEQESTKLQNASMESDKPSSTELPNEDENDIELNKTTEKSSEVTTESRVTESAEIEKQKPTETPIDDEIQETNTELIPELVPKEELTTKSPDQALDQDTTLPDSDKNVQPDLSQTESPESPATESEIASIPDLQDIKPQLPEGDAVQDLNIEKESMITSEMPVYPDVKVTEASVTESNEYLTVSNKQDLEASEVTSPTTVGPEDISKVHPVADSQEQSTNIPDLPDTEQAMHETVSPISTETETEIPEVEPELVDKNKPEIQEDKPILTDKETSEQEPEMLGTMAPDTEVPVTESKVHDDTVPELPEVTETLDKITSPKPIFDENKPEEVPADDESKRTELPQLYSTESDVTAAPVTITGSEMKKDQTTQKEIQATDAPIFSATEQEPLEPTIAHEEPGAEQPVTEILHIDADIATHPTESSASEPEEITFIPTLDDYPTVKPQEYITEKISLPESERPTTEEYIPIKHDETSIVPTTEKEYGTKESITEMYELSTKSSDVIPVETDLPEFDTTNAQKVVTETPEQAVTDLLEPVTKISESNIGQSETDTTPSTAIHETNDFTESPQDTDGRRTETPLSLVTQTQDHLIEGIKQDSDTKQPETSVTEKMPPQEDITKSPDTSQAMETEQQTELSVPVSPVTNIELDESVATEKERVTTEKSKYENETKTPQISGEKAELVPVTEPHSVPEESDQTSIPPLETEQNEVVTESMQATIAEEDKTKLTTTSSIPISKEQVDSNTTEKPLETEPEITELQHKVTVPDYLETTEYTIIGKPVSDSDIEKHEENTELPVQLTTEKLENEFTTMQGGDITIQGIPSSIPEHVDTNLIESEVPAGPTEKVTTLLPEVESTSEPKYETTPYLIELEEHPHIIIDESSSTLTPYDEDVIKSSEQDQPVTELLSDNGPISGLEETTERQDETRITADAEPNTDGQPISMGPNEVIDITTQPSTVTESIPSTSDQSSEPELDTRYSDDNAPPVIEIEKTTLTVPTSTVSSTQDSGLNAQTDLDKDKPVKPEVPIEITPPEKEMISTSTKASTKYEEPASSTTPPFDKYTKPEDKIVETVPSTATPEIPKPSEIPPTEEISSPEDGSHDTSGTSGYGQEPDYFEEDQTFGPGTCRYGGKVYVSAQQIPRDDPCDFCFCFRSDIICLQQSCPPPIHGCHEEPIQGFCCPRYECPVSMATTLNMTTTTTTTTTTLPPNFPTHSYKGAAQRRGCQIKGHTYKVGEVVRASSGPCLHCTCGGDGQMKCDPKACTPEPMLRQMIAAAVSAKRRR